MSTTVQQIRRKVTIDEFRAIPEGPPYFEFEQGELIPMASPNRQHQEILLNLSFALRRHLTVHKTGRFWIELDTELPNNRIYVPDLVYLSADHLNRLSDADGKIHGVPDLVVEIVSPHSSGRDRVVKFNAYLDAGVPWYWMVDADALVIEEFHNVAGRYVRTAGAAKGEAGREVFQPEALPGLEIDTRALLEG